MDHEHVEQHHVIHRYLGGNLSPEEQDAFEDHYLDCPECLAELERMESLHRGLEGVALDALRSPATVAPETPVRSPGVRRWQPALAAAVVLVLLAPLGWLLVRQDRLQDELARLRAPRVGAAVAYLSPLRGEAPPALLTLPAEPRPLVFVLDLGPAPAGPYRVSLWREDPEERVWSQPAAATTSDGEITVSVSTEFFQPGDYVFRVHRPSPEGRSEPLARFPFRAVPEEKIEKNRP